MRLQHGHRHDDEYDAHHVQCDSKFWVMRMMNAFGVTKFEA